MPVDRFLHPRCGQSQKVTSLSSDEFRAWTQYLLSADDFGVMRAAATTLQDHNDYLNAKPTRKVQAWLHRLIVVGLLNTFEHQGRSYVFQWDWQTWQKVEYPRGTLHPTPPLESLAICDEDTRALFDIHPGGKGRKFAKPSRKIPDASSESFENASGKSANNARAYVREVASGKRLVANGSLEGSLRETEPPLDAWFNDLHAAYPAKARSRGYVTEQAFVRAVTSQGDPLKTLRLMVFNLESQKRGSQWLSGKVPRLDRWLSEGLWEQRHDAPQVTAKTAGTLAAVAEIMKEGE